MKALLVYFKGYVKDSILGPVFKLIEASFELLVPLVIAGIVDTTIPNKDQNHLFMMIFLLFGLAVIGVVVAISAQYFSSRAAVGYARGLTNDLYAKIMRLSKEKRDEIGTSSLVTRLTGDTFQIQTGINQFLSSFEGANYRDRSHYYGIPNQSTLDPMVSCHGLGIDPYNCTS